MKLQEMREKSIDELNEAIISYKKDLFDLRKQKALHKLEYTAQISKLRILIAKVKKIRTEKMGNEKKEGNENA